jgi:WD40 repeat protein
VRDAVPFEDEVPTVPPARGDGRSFDVFLSHNGRDKPLVERIAERLKRARVEPWFDAWHLVPGMDWQRGLAEGLAASRSCAVFVGPADLGAWENQEVAVALDRAARDPEFRLFLVLLPGLPERFDAAGLLPFLRMRTWVDYRRGLDDERAFQGLVSAIQGVPLGPDVPIEPDAELCPYRGLEVFEEEHAEFFFGRDADIQRLLEKFKATRFLAVLGASGSGKSSLVRAGLVPALRRGALPGEERWEIAILRPGPQPLETLAAQLLRLGAQRAMQQTVDGLTADPRTFHLASSLMLAEHPPGTRLLLVVDQFEEVFTLCRNEQERTAFLANLLYAATIPDGRSGVLLTMRADFYHRCGAYPELAQQLAAEQYLVSPLQLDGLRQALEEPARRVGLSFEPGLVATILEDVEDQPGALPLLEHALLEVWRRRAGGILTLAGYRESGGVQGAIAKRAEEVFDSLEPDRQELARRTFLRLTQPGEGTEDTRRRAQLAELESGDADDDIVPVLTRLVNARLLTTSRDESVGGEVVEVAHEALIRGWPRLRGWIDEDRAGLRVHRRLTEAAREWERLDRDESALYRGARLAEAQEWRSANEVSLNKLERGFLAASRTAERDELALARRRTRRLRMLAVVLLALLAAAVALGLLAQRQTRTANAQRQVATSRQLAMQALINLESRPDRSLLLAAEAFRRADTAESRRALFEGLTSRPHLVGTLRTSGEQVSVAFAPDGGSFISVDRDGKVSIWDAKTLHREQGPTWAGWRGTVGPLTVLDDGRTVIASTLDGTARFDLRTGQSSVVEPRGADDPWETGASADGRIVVQGFYEGSMIVWDTAGNRQEVLARVRVGSESIDNIAVNPSGTVVALSTYDRGVVLWDVPGRRWLGAPLISAETTVFDFSFSPDGRLVIVGRDTVGRDIVDLWDVMERKRVRRFQPGDDVQSLTFSRDGGLVAIADDSGTILVTGTKREWTGPSMLAGGVEIRSIVLSPNSRLLVTVTESGQLIVWDLEREHHRLLRELPDSALVESAAFGLDGTTLVTAEADDGVIVSRWDVEQATRIARSRLGAGDPVGLGVSPDGRTVAVSWKQGTVQLWDVLRRERHDRNPPPLKQDDFDRHLVFSPDGRLLVLAGEETPIKVWDVPSGRLLGALKGLQPGSYLDTFVFAPDGDILAVLTEDKLRLWNARTLEPVGRAVAVEADSLAFSGGSDSLVTGLSDGTLVVWAIRKGEPTRPRPLEREGEQIDTWETAGSPHGGLLASGSEDGIVLWDVSSRRQIGVIDRGDRDAMAFSPERHWFLATDVLVDVDPASWAQKACTLAARELTPDEWRHYVGEEQYVGTCAELRDSPPER